MSGSRFLQKPADWAKLTLRKIDFYEPLLVTVRELVREAEAGRTHSDDALFACAPGIAPRGPCCGSIWLRIRMR